MPTERPLQAVRDRYFDAMRSHAHVQAQYRAIAAPSLRQEGDFGIALRRHTVQVRAIHDAIIGQVERPEVQAELLEMLNRHGRDVTKAEQMLATGTADERTKAQARLQVLNWRQQHDPFLQVALQVLSSREQGSGVLAGIVLPAAAGELQEQQEEEDRLKNCKFEVFPEQLTALEAYSAVRADNTVANRRAFGQALAGLQHKDASGARVPITHIGSALWSLTDHAVRMLEERTNPRNNVRRRLQKWAGVTEREQTVWKSICELTARDDPAGAAEMKRQQIIVDRKFGAFYRAWYRGQIVPGEDTSLSNLNKTDVRTAFYEIHSPVKRTRRRSPARAEEPATSGIREVEIDPHLTSQEAFALAAMLIQIDNYEISSPDGKSRTPFKLPTKVFNDCRAFTRSYFEAFQRPDDTVIMASRRGAIAKLSKLLADDALVETQVAGFRNAEASDVTPDERLQRIIGALLSLQEQVDGQLERFLYDTQLGNGETPRYQMGPNGTRDPFDITLLPDTLPGVSSRSWKIPAAPSN